MTETAVTIEEQNDEDDYYEGYMQFGDGAILSIEHLVEAMSALDKQKEIEYTSE